MAPKKSNLPFNEETNRQLWDNDEIRVASATECTGLMPTPVTTDDAVESYSNIYDIPLPKRRGSFRFRRVLKNRSVFCKFLQTFPFSAKAPFQKGLFALYYIQSHIPVIQKKERDL